MQVHYTKCGKCGNLEVQVIYMCVWDQKEAKYVPIGDPEHCLCSCGEFGRMKTRSFEVKSLSAIGAIELRGILDSIRKVMYAQDGRDWGLVDPSQWSIEQTWDAVEKIDKIFAQHNLIPKEITDEKSK